MTFLIKQGQQRAKERGVKMGRPSTLAQHKEKVAELLGLGKTVSAISMQLDLPYSSAHKLVKSCRQISRETGIPLGSVFRLSKEIRAEHRRSLEIESRVS